MKHPPRVLHVRIAESGGGAVHVEGLRSALRGEVVWSQVDIPQQDARNFPMGWLRARRAIRGALRTRQPDLLHAHGVRGAMLSLMARPHCPVVVTVHGLHSIRRARGLARPLVRRLNAAILRRANRVLVLGQSDERTIRDSALARDGAVRMIRHGIVQHELVDRAEARQQLGIEVDASVLLWMARFDPQKDPLACLDLAETARPGEVVVMAGEGALFDHVREEARRRNLGVVFTGWVDPRLAFTAADLFVTTSRWEGLPQAALEAAAAGLPVVAVAAPGNTDLLAWGVDAVIVPDTATPTTVSAIRRLLDNDVARRELGQRLQRQVLETFTPENLRRDVSGVYIEVLDERAGSRAT